MRAGITSLQQLCLFTVERLLLLVRGLSPKEVAEIEEVLSQEGKTLATASSHPCEQSEPAEILNDPLLSQQEIAIALEPSPGHPIELSRNGHQTQAEEIVTAEVVSEELSIEELIAEAAEIEPEVVRELVAAAVVAEAADILEVGPEKLDLYRFWHRALGKLNEVEEWIIVGYYGLEGDELVTLEELAEELELTTERVYQLKEKALQTIRNSGTNNGGNDGGGTDKEISELDRFLGDCIARAGGLLTVEEWEQCIDEQAIWETDEPKPFLLPLLCDLFEGYSFSHAYQVICFDPLGEHLTTFELTVRSLLRQHKRWLTVDELVNRLPPLLPVAPVLAPMRESAFIRKAVSLFEGVRHGIKTESPLEPPKVEIWLGQPGTRLYRWECKLRAQLKKVAWIGQLAVSETEFKDLCQIIQEEAQGPNYFTKETERQPAKVPATLFITTMVFAARYSEQTADEFWEPYLQHVWGVEYTPAFMTRCRKRFGSAIIELAATLHLEFPGALEGEVVSAIYRHALLPRYVQDDFAGWLAAKWQALLAHADSPPLLLNDIHHDRSLEYLPRRLQKFILGKDTQETAADLIATMAAAIALHVQNGESIEAIAALLADTPIKQELWREVAQAFAKEFAQEKKQTASSLRLSRPRVQWLWIIEHQDIALRVQNIILPADNSLEGEPNRLVWVDSTQSDPTEAEIEEEVSTWRMNSGERVVQEVWLSEPIGPLQGQLLLLTDMDEVAANMAIPPLPADPIQFFRPLQQGTSGLPVDTLQVDEGLWYVCAQDALTFLDDNEQVIEPETPLPVPDSLRDRYRWAAQVHLTLPIQLIQRGEIVLTLERKTNQSALAEPSLTGNAPINGLSSQVQRTFANTQLSLKIDYGGEHLLKQASLWLHGENGWRYHRPLHELVEAGLASLNQDALSIDLAKLLPSTANLYTLELRASLQPLFATPLYFAVVPGLYISTYPSDQPFTVVNPYRVTLHGVAEEAVVLSDEMRIVSGAKGGLVVQWHNLSKDPHLLLRFGKCEIPLAWSVPRFSAWLEPKPTTPYLTLDQFRRATLHAVSKDLPSEAFTLSVSGEGARRFRLTRGHFRQSLGDSQLYEIVRLARSTRLDVTVQFGTAEWTLCEVRQRPELSQAHVEYAPLEKLIHLKTGLHKAWDGDLRFLAQSLTNPFDPLALLDESRQLSSQHQFPIALSKGQYRLLIELDGAPLSLNEQATLFTVTDVRTADTDTEALIKKTLDGFKEPEGLLEEIRSGQLISADRVEDFVLLWAEIAEIAPTQLTPVTLYQLAAVPPYALQNFQQSHLQTLWPVLAALNEVQNKAQWGKEHGLLPAWIFLPNPLAFTTVIRGYEWPVYPIQMYNGGTLGRGYGFWPIDGHKVQVYVQWRSLSATRARAEAGIVETLSTSWAKMRLSDTQDLFYCHDCGRLVATNSHLTSLADSLAAEVMEAHRHGRATHQLRQLNVESAKDDPSLLVDFAPQRRGKSLVEIFDEYAVVYPSATEYLPEPTANALALAPDTWRQLLALSSVMLRYGANSDESSPWAGATRLINKCKAERSLSEQAQGVFALALLMRTAAYYQGRYTRLIKDASLSEADVKRLLAAVEEQAPEHLRWALTWAELLMLHSPGSFYKTNR